MKLPYEILKIVYDYSNEEDQFTLSKTNKFFKKMYGNKFPKRWRVVYQECYISWTPYHRDFFHVEDAMRYMDSKNNTHYVSIWKISRCGDYLTQMCEIKIYNDCRCRCRGKTLKANESGYFTSSSDEDEISDY